MGIDFQALTWEAKDDEDGYGYFISIMGKTGDGRSVCVTTSYNPYFFIRLPDNFSSTKTELFQIIEKKYPGYVVSHETVKGKCLWGFQNNEQNNFERLEFKNLECKKRLDYFFRRPVYMSRGPTMFKVYE